MLRHRYIAFAFLLLLVPLLDVLTDPNTGIITDMPYGASMLSYLVLLSRGLLSVVALYILFKWIFDRLEYQPHLIYNKDKSAGGALLIFMGLCILAFSVLLHAVVSL